MGIGAAELDADPLLESWSSLGCFALFESVQRPPTMIVARARPPICLHDGDFALLLCVVAVGLPLPRGSGSGSGGAGSAACCTHATVGTGYRMMNSFDRTQAVPATSHPSGPSTRR